MKKAKRKRKKEINTERLELRISPRLMKIVDDWRRAEPDIPTRSEAIRRMVACCVNSPLQSEDQK